MPTMPGKTRSEGVLEIVEQGTRDRQARLAAEAAAQAKAEAEQRLAVYRQRQAAAMVLVQEDESEAHAFDATLGELAAIVERLSRVSAALRVEQDWLGHESRALGDMTGVLGGGWRTIPA